MAEAASDLLGYPNKILLKKNWASLFVLQDAQVRKMVKHPTTEDRFTAFATCLSSHGQSVPCEISAAFFQDEQAVGRMITTITDLSTMIGQEQRRT